MQCPICRGSGEYELNGTTYDCQRCGGDGQVTPGEGEWAKKCGPCNGNGKETYAGV